MPKGIYAAASSMVTDARALEASAANIANAQSAGYRRQVALREGFDVILAERGRTENIAGNGGAGIIPDGQMFAFDQGQLQVTGNQFDVALIGDGFFQVRDADDRAWLTRAGDFSIDDTGTLRTSQGHQVEGQAGPIIIPAEASRISIDETGRIYAHVPQSNGGEVTSFVDLLRISTVDDPHALQAKNGQYFLAPDNVRDAAFGDTRVRQGSLENANVEPVTELVTMITIQRRYDAAQRAMRTQNEAGRGFSDLLRG